MSVKIRRVTAIGETAKALLVEIGSVEVWIPQSQIDNDSEVYQINQTGMLIISDWFAEELEDRLGCSFIDGGISF